MNVSREKREQMHRDLWLVGLQPEEIKSAALRKDCQKVYDEMMLKEYKVLYASTSPTRITERPRPFF